MLPGSWKVLEFFNQESGNAVNYQACGVRCCQRELDGDVTLCCAGVTGRPSGLLKCGGAAGICQNLYDSAPSGRYGTMSYLCRSAVQCLSMPTAPDGNLDCVIQ